MRGIRFIGLVTILPALFSGMLCYSQSSGIDVMFYNTENYFDPFDDSLTVDEEFTPDGAMHWTRKRFQQKSDHLFKVFMAAGEWEPPQVIGLAEVENRYVLHYLTKETPFGKFDYGIVHYDSPDKRGIDVALLYRKKNVRVLSSRAVPVVFKKYPEKKTRDILYVLLTTGRDTIAFFVNHWPSRWGGYLESESYRLEAARVLIQVLDSMRNVIPNRKIVIMGDFNDEPGDPSLSLIAKKDHEGYINLMMPLYDKKEGTLYYDHRWWLFDQFIVSDNLFPAVTEVRIFNPAFLLTREGDIPFRTYVGMRYQNGFSDHLPVLLKIQIR